MRNTVQEQPIPTATHAAEVSQALQTVLDGLAAFDVSVSQAPPGVIDPAAFERWTAAYQQTLLAVAPQRLSRLTRAILLLQAEQANTRPGSQARIHIAEAISAIEHACRAIVPTDSPR